MEKEYQLRGEENHVDTGELVFCDSLDEAMDKFLEGHYWKLSWTNIQGKRIRLVKLFDCVGPENGPLVEITSSDTMVKDVERILEKIH